MVNAGTWEIRELEHHPEPRGDLTAVNDMKQFPFPPGRIYWITRLQPEHERGSHAHKLGQQAFVVLNGKATFSLYNQREEHAVITLEHANQMIVLGPLVWVTMLNFAPDSAVLVLADAPYSDADYIRSWAEFQLYKSAIATLAVSSGGNTRP